MIVQKRTLRRRWQRSRNPLIKTQLNKATKELSLLIKEFENQSLYKYLSKLSNEKSSDYSLWKAAKSFKRPQLQFPPIKMNNGQWAKSNDEKVKIFSEHLMTTFTPHETSDSVDLEDPTSPEDVAIQLYSTHDVKDVIGSLTPKKAPGFDLITAEILVQLPNNTIKGLTNIINACLRLNYVPTLWKVAEVIMIAKPGKPPNDVTSYRPISLLPILSKLLEKLFLKHMMPIITERNLIPSHQFGFREKHSTIDQIHRITNIIESAFENKKVCSAVFLDVSQAFDKVWHKGLIHKLRCLLPKSYCDFLLSYISERHFRIKLENTFSDLKPIHAGVPQGSILGPVLYLLYTSDVPTSSMYFIASFADDTALLTTGNTVEESTEALQKAVDSVNIWTKKWRIKLNNLKSVHVDFTNLQIHHKNIYIDNVVIPYSNSAKYLGMTLDAKLHWKEHVKKKKEELDIKLSKLYWLLGRNTKTSTFNKLLVYNQVLKPVWSYGIQLWGCTSKSNVEIIQRFQNKALRSIMNVPWYVRNSDLQRDIGIDPVVIAIEKYAAAHMLRLTSHPNVEASKLAEANINDRRRRLQRIRPQDLIRSGR